MLKCREYMRRISSGTWRLGIFDGHIYQQDWISATSAHLTKRRLWILITSSHCWFWSITSRKGSKCKKLPTPKHNHKHVHMVINLTFYKHHQPSPVCYVLVTSPSQTPVESVSRPWHLAQRTWKQHFVMMALLPDRMGLPVFFLHPLVSPWGG